MNISGTDGRENRVVSLVCITLKKKMVGRRTARSLS